MTTEALTTPASFFETAFQAIVTGVRKRRARRAHRIALAALMQMDAVRLDDLGLEAADLIEALSGREPGPGFLARRRAERAARSAAPRR